MNDQSSYFVKIKIFKCVNIVVITILNSCAFYCSEQGGVLAPFFATDEPGDDELVVKDD